VDNIFSTNLGILAKKWWYIKYGGPEGPCTVSFKFLSFFCCRKFKFGLQKVKIPALSKSYACGLLGLKAAEY
jgi:hypothetical protein